MSTINYKFILIGNSGVGKECFFKKLSTSLFSGKGISTIGLDKKTINLNLDVCNKEGKIENKNFQIDLFDTAGQEKFRAITYSYFKGADGIFIVYDITYRESFESVETWIEGIKDNIGNRDESRYAFILIGNKLDLIEENNEKRDVDEVEAKQMCEKYNMVWGGEQSFTKLEPQGCIELLTEYTGEIYKRVGEKTERQNYIKIAKLKNKEKKLFSCFKK